MNLTALVPEIPKENLCGSSKYISNLFVASSRLKTGAMIITCAIVIILAILLIRKKLKKEKSVVLIALLIALSVLLVLSLVVIVSFDMELKKMPA